jgi:hypothetical protein
MKSILENIKNAVESIEWTGTIEVQKTKKEKALNLCIYIYNTYVYEGGDFNVYRQFSKSYFKSIIKTSSYVYEIKNSLIKKNILEVYKNGTYKMKKTNKAYRFKTSLINGFYTDLNGPTFNSDIKTDLNGPKTIGQDLKTSDKVNSNLFNLSNIITNKSNTLHISGPTMETYINKGLENITFTKEVNDYINKFYITREDILVNDEIKDEYVKVIFDLDSYNYKKDNALNLAQQQGLYLIKYKKNFYIDNIETFLIRKTNDIRLIMRKSIFEIENKIFRVSRNETNRRLDYNLTNMKSTLFNYMLFEGEELVELDIANAQFSILSFLTDELDDNFIKLTREGQLYKYISDKLNITLPESKEKMFRVAFDRVEEYQNDIREIFPKTMEFIDGYKNELGYAAFSKLCQNAESLIMIDGLLNLLINKGYKVFTIHDAIRVKKSDLELIKKEIENYFNNINFKCLLRIKNKEQKKETEIINFKGIKQVEIDKVSTEDKKLFLSKINGLYDIGLEPSESLMYDMNIFSVEKTWYLYTKWRKRNPYKEYKIIE